MKYSLTIRLLCTGLCLSATSLCFAVDEIAGQTAGGAHYKFVIPDDWVPADGLAIWNHGFDTAPIGPVTDMGPLVSLQLEQGFAVAASSYSQPGWALFNTTRDLREMVQAFTGARGEPASVYLSGGSLGGLVTAQAIEEGGVGNVVGAYSVCGATAGSRVWDGALDLRLMYDAVCDDVLGASIPGGALGYPAELLPDPDDGDLTNFLAGSVGLSIQACTGILFDGSLRSAEQQQRLDRLLGLARIPESFLLTNMAYSTLVLADTIQRPDKLNGEPALSNIGVDYGDADINARIARTSPSALGAVHLAGSYTPSGAVGDTKIVALHTDKDGLVLVENMGEYASKVPVSNLVAGVVVEDEPTHCGFSEAEIAAGWNALLQWTADNQQPTAADLQTRCESEVSIGPLTGPCRIDPDFALMPMDARILPRPASDFTVSGGISGAWYDASRDGEGWLVEVLDEQTAVVYWFTYPVLPDIRTTPAVSTVLTQTWLLGIGRVDGNQIIIDDTRITRGAIFGADFNPDDVQRDPWGRLTLRFEDCDSGAMHYSGPLGFNQGARQLQRLNQIGTASCDSTSLVTGTAGLSGSWYNAARSGEGWIVQVLADRRAFVYWFTYDDQGRQSWITGLGDLTGNTLTIDDALITRGTQFGDDFDPNQVQRNPWGSLTLVFDDCSNGSISYDSSLAEYGAGQLSMTRLTTIAGTECELDL